MVDLPKGKHAIGTKWVYRNKKDERGIVVRNKARLVAQGYTQEEGIDYDEVFTSVARIKAIGLFLAYASFMRFILYQMDVKSAFLYGTIEKEMTSSLGLLKIGSLMYLTASRLDIMFVVCACARFQVTPKVLHLHAVKRIFRYLKGQPKLVLWYPRDSLFDLESFFDSDYARASLDRKSTTGGCQFLSKILFSWQCKKQTIVANSTTKAEYVAAANCCGQVLWIQNQMLNYGFNFMNTKIYIDNESTICIMKNPVFHSKTKHTEIRHHFIRDSYEKKLIQVIKIHTDHNVADLLTKAFDVSRTLLKYYSSMADLKFVDQHNMVAYLEKSDENAEFHQIEDFLFISSINYALTVSPTIYASYIEQFWNTATSKTVNSVKQIHAIVDGRAVVISESSVRSDLLFNDEDGITCLTNDEIFENLALMGYEQLSTKLTFQKGSFSPQWKFLIHTILHRISSKSTAWNEFSTNLASAIICLAKGQKFIFSKSIFDGMLKNLDPKKFLMYPSVERAITTDASLVAAHDSHNIIRTQTMAMPNVDIPQGMDTGGSPRRQETMGVLLLRLNFVPPTPHDSPLSGGNTPGSDEGRIELIQELMETCTSLKKRVLALEEAKTAQDRVITRLKLRVKRLEKIRKARTPQPMKRRLFKGRVKTSIDKSLGEDASKQGRNDDKSLADTKVIVEDKSSGEKGGSTADQKLVKMRSEKAKEKEKGVVFRDEEEPPRLTTTRSTTTLKPLLTIDPKDKDVDLAQLLHQEELAEAERRQRERVAQKEATNATLAEEFDEIQARIDADHELAIRLTHEEQEK
ncbi:putative ribonuclease H-like domain-containing protein [Tanacetum coccineum]